MIEGAKWRKWGYFYVPMAFFLVFLLFPFYWMIITSFRPDGELYRPWNAVNYNPFWTTNPTLEHMRYLFQETLFSSWLWNTTFIALVSTAISLVCGVFAGYALSRLNFPFAVVSAPASSSPIWCRRPCCSFRWPRSFAITIWAIRPGR